MNAAAVLALCAALLQLGMGLLMLGVSRAPGWRAARCLAVIALTAAIYSAANTFFALPGFSDDAVLIASRWNMFAGSIHTAAWIVYTHGGATASARALPPVLRVIVGALAAVGGFILLTGAHAAPGAFSDMTVSWAHVAYRSPVMRPWAEWYAVLMVAGLLLPFTRFVRQALRGEVSARVHLVGFVVFFVCIVVEVLVANGVISTVYLADVGFLAVVVPVAIGTVRRVVDDAGRLDAQTRALAGEVEARTAALDRAQLALAESERHAALGRLAAGVGHEINNPLTYLGLSLETIESWARQNALPPEIADAVASARDGTERIHHVVDSLRSYTRARVDDRRVHDTGDLVRSALRVAAHQLRFVARVDLELAESLAIRGDEARLVQVLVNLLTNASQAIEAQPRDAQPHDAQRHDTPASIVVRTCALDDMFAAIEVIDTGPGIAPEHLRLLTQPYFTTRAGTGGTGLGLYIARGIVEQHGGRLEIASTVGVGTTVRVVLPQAKQESSDADDTPSESPAATFAGKRPHVLIVDDEPILTRGLARALAPYCDVDIANSGDEGIARVAASDPPVDAVVCDIMMPGMSGIEFADLLASRDPALRRRTLFMTGGAVTPAAMAFVQRADVRCLHKPIAAGELAEEISRLLASV